MSAKTALAEILKDLSSEELEEFNSNVKLEKFKMAPLAQSRAEVTKHGVKVELMVEKYSKEWVEVAKTVLQKMNRTDLVQRFSDSSSGTREEHSVVVKRPSLAQRVERITPAIHLLMDILSNLTKEELKHFTGVMIPAHFKSFKSYYSWLLFLQTDYWVIVSLIVVALGQHSVKTTIEVLKDMKRTDLLQRLSDARSRSKKGHPDELQPALIQKVAMMAAVKQTLLETLHCLSEKELQHFIELLPQRIFQTGDRAEEVDQMLEIFGQHSVKLTREILVKIKRTDLMQMWSETSLEPKEKETVDEHQHKKPVEAVTADVKWILFKTLRGLSDMELRRFRFFLKFTYFQRSCPLIYSWSDIKQAKYLYALVDLMGENQQPVEVTTEVFMDMNRTDLVDELSGNISRLKGGSQSAQPQEVTSSGSLHWTLLKTLAHDLSCGEFEEFKKIVLHTAKKKDPRSVEKAGRVGMVQVMVEIYGQQCVEETQRIIQRIRWTDTVERTFRASPDFGVYSYTSMTADYRPLLETLEALTLSELEEFKFILQDTQMEKSLRRISKYQVKMANSREMARLLVQSFGPQSVEVVKDVLQIMKRTGLVEKLSGTGSGLKTQSTGEKISKLETKKSETDFTMTADHQQLLKTLSELSVGELEKFKHVLQYTKMKEGLPKIPRDRLETADKEETVKLLVGFYGRQSLGVTKDVLERINRLELVQKLLQSSPESQEPSRSLERESCGSNPPHWIKLEPEVNSIGGDESPTYSLECETGNYFECSVSGMLWVCKEKVSFQYQFCSWEGHMERMENINYMPAGPLMNIRIIAGKFDEVYLPHWISTDDNPDVLKEFAVLHIEDCGDVVERVAEVTPSHVKLSEPIFSPRGVLMKVGFPVKISCNVLIYYKPLTPFLKLHVYVIPCDPALQQTVAKKEFLMGFQTIQKPRPDKYLKMQQGFSLTADIKSAKILPKKITLRYDNQDPNFYEVFIEKPDRNFQLQLSHTSKGEAQSQQVWSCEIRKDDYQCRAPEDKHSVDDQLSALVQKSVTITPTDRERLLQTLEGLKQEEFRKFKWFLEDKGLLADLPSISTSELEGKDMLEMVDLMLKVYSTGSIELSRKILEKINRNDLVETLSDIS